MQEHSLRAGFCWSLTTKRWIRTFGLQRALGVCVCVCICTCVYTCMHVCLCVCTWVCSPVCVHVCAFMCSLVHLCASTCVHVCICPCVHLCVSMYAFVCMSMGMCLCMCPCVCVCIHVWVYRGTSGVSQLLVQCSFCNHAFLDFSHTSLSNLEVLCPWVDSLDSCKIPYSSPSSKLSFLSQDISPRNSEDHHQEGHSHWDLRPAVHKVLTK